MIDFAELQAGEVIALLGENGAGKTTLMNILFGHYVADEGEVEAFGEARPGDLRAALDAGIGMVHQHFTLADNMTVLKTLRLARKAHRLRLDAGAAARIVVSQDFGLRLTRTSGFRHFPLVSARVEILKALS